MNVIIVLFCHYRVCTFSIRCSYKCILLILVICVYRNSKMLQNESKIIVIIRYCGTLTHSSLNMNAIYNRNDFFFHYPFWINILLICTNHLKFSPFSPLCYQQRLLLLLLLLQLWQWSLRRKFHSQLKLIQNNKYNSERKRKWKWWRVHNSMFNHFARNCCSAVNMFYLS